MIRKSEITGKAADAKGGAKKSHNPLSRRVHSPFDHILYLQRKVGNQGVQRLFKSGHLQAKLRIGQPDAIYEQEADRVANEIMRMPDSAIQMKPG